jgi:hypothetical protein
MGCDGAILGYETNSPIIRYDLGKIMRVGKYNPWISSWGH